MQTDKMNGGVRFLNKEEIASNTFEKEARK